LAPLIPILNLLKSWTNLAVGNLIINLFLVNFLALHLHVCSELRILWNLSVQNVVPTLTSNKRWDLSLDGRC
jgi:hypothetical protein